MNKLIIVGAGSVGKFLAYNIEEFSMEYHLLGYLDDDPHKHNKMLAGYPVLGGLDLLAKYSGNGYSLIFGIAIPNTKISILKRYPHLEFHFPNFISDRAWLSNQVKMGKGCIIYPGVSINYETRLGDFVVINMNCAIGHNCTIGDHSSLAPGVNLAGHTVIGQAVDMGIGACTIQNVHIGGHSIVGGQSMIIADVNTNDKIAGIPAKSIAKK